MFGSEDGQAILKYFNEFWMKKKILKIFVSPIFRSYMSF